MRMVSVLVGVMLFVSACATPLYVCTQGVANTGQPVLVCFPMDDDKVTRLSGEKT